MNEFSLNTAGDDSVFSSGVKPIGLKSAAEVKILLCHILGVIAQPITEEQLVQSVIESELVNFFEATDAIQRLHDAKQIEYFEESGKFIRLTEDGRKNLEQLKNMIPITARERTAQIAIRLLAQNRRLHQAPASVEKVSDGFLLNASIKDIGTDLLQMSVFFPDEDSAKYAKTAFLNNPTVIYKGLMALFTGQYDQLAELPKLMEKENLF